jgi:hydroxycarboxylate dehydrogenase B
MSRLVSHPELVRLGTALFQATGAPRHEAALVSTDLVTNSLMGHDSHGVLRIPEYLDLIGEGRIVPGAPIRVERTSATTAIVDCAHNFGPVGARRAVEMAMDIAAEQRTACVITHRCNHVARLGTYVQAAAERGFVALATCNSPVHGHFVLPWGGREPRLATNPVAYGVPTSGDPIVADFSTSVIPEGKVRVYRNEGKQLPPGCVVDAGGRPTIDPTAFYGPPRGSLLPLGGLAGHKGFALGLLVELLGSALAGVGPTDPSSRGNGNWFMVFDPAAFVPLERFKRLVDETIAYMKSSPPAAGFEEVLIAGECEFRTQRRRLEQGIPVDETTWRAIRGHACRLGVDVGE